LETKLKVDITPHRDHLPRANSVIISGILQRKRKIVHGIRKAPPPLLATIRGNLQIFPVPIAIPKRVNIKTQLDVKRSRVPLIKTFLHL